MNLDMTKGSPLKLILKFLVPVLLGCVFQQLYNMVDTIIVGKGVGSDALAAVGATGTIVFFILGFMNGLTTGFTVLSSQRYGAGDYEGLRKSVGNAFVLGLIVTVIMTIASLLGMDWLLRIMQTPEDIFDMSKEYIVIICVGIIFTTLYNLTASILRAVGNSKVPLYFLILSALLNVVLDLFFIMVLSWGVAGAAIATVISQGVSGILCLVFLLTKVDSRCSFPMQMIDLFHQTYGKNIKVFDFFVPFSVKFPESNAMGVSNLKHNPSGKGTAMYDRLAKEVAHER